MKHHYKRLKTRIDALLTNLNKQKHFFLYSNALYWLIIVVVYVVIASKSYCKPGTTLSTTVTLRLPLQAGNCTITPITNLEALHQTNEIVPSQAGAPQPTSAPSDLYQMFYHTFDPVKNYFMSSGGGGVHQPAGYGPTQYQNPIYMLQGGTDMETTTTQPGPHSQPSSQSTNSKYHWKFWLPAGNFTDGDNQLMLGSEQIELLDKSPPPVITFGGQTQLGERFENGHPMVDQMTTMRSRNARMRKSTCK